MSLNDGKNKLNRHHVHDMEIIRKNIAVCDLLIDKSADYTNRNKEYYSFYYGFSLALKLLSDEEFTNKISALNMAVKRLELLDPHFMTNYTLMLLNGDGRYLYFSRQLDMTSNYDTRYYNSLANECSNYDNVDVLERLSKLKGFNLNVTHKVSNTGLKVLGDYFPYSEKNYGIPLSLTSKKARMFKWCLENGADISMKIDIMQEYLDYKLIRSPVKKKSLYYDVEMKALAYKYYGLDFGEYITKSKKKTLITVFNEVTKQNLVNQKVIKHIYDLTNALINDNRVVFDNLASFKDMINNSLLDKKFICQIIDLNRFDWFEKMHKENLLDVNISNQGHSLIHYAMNKRRPYMVKYILENNLHSEIDLKDGNPLFYAMIKTYPKLAVKLTAHEIYPINTENNAQYELFGEKFINSQFYKETYIKEKSDYERNILSLDVADFEIEANNNTKSLKMKRI